jgi:hypothetical protein
MSVSPPASASTRLIDAPHAVDPAFQAASRGKAGEPGRYQNRRNPKNYNPSTE